MLRFSYLIMSVICISGVAYCGYTLMASPSRAGADDVKKPETFLTATIVDLGQANQNQKLNASATVTNFTRYPITIKNIAKSCSCADLTIVKAELAAGESTEIHITWATGSKRGRVQDVLTMQFEVLSEPRKTTLETLAIRADVEPECELSSEKLYFKSPGEKHTVSLQSPSQTPYDFMNTYCESKSLQVRITADRKSIEITFVGESLADFKEATILCETNAKASKWLRVNVSTPVGDK